MAKRHLIIEYERLCTLQTAYVDDIACLIVCQMQELAILYKVLAS